MATGESPAAPGSAGTSQTRRFVSELQHRSAPAAVPSRSIREERGSHSSARSGPPQAKLPARLLLPAAAAPTSHTRSMPSTLAEATEAPSPE